MKSTKFVVLLICASLTLAACGGRSAESTTTVTTVTTGQQLTDLKAAFDAGAINQDEYDKKRAEILKGQ